jgi:hypothetical protein
VGVAAEAVSIADGAMGFHPVVGAAAATFAEISTAAAAAADLIIIAAEWKAAAAVLKAAAVVLRADAVVLKVVAADLRAAAAVLRAAAAEIATAAAAEIILMAAAEILTAATEAGAVLRAATFIVVAAASMATAAVVGVVDLGAAAAVSIGEAGGCPGIVEEAGDDEKSRRERGNTHIQLQQQQQLQPVQKSCSLCNSCCLCNRTAHQNQPNGMGGKIEKRKIIVFLFVKKLHVMFFGKNTYTTLFTNRYPYCAKVSNDAYLHVHRIPLRCTCCVCFGWFFREYCTELQPIIILIIFVAPKILW